ncbi:MAG: glycosyltransferase family 39 protein [bacterium]|nr:glycosyltransferase family 39 protein [bacterium]
MEIKKDKIILFLIFLLAFGFRLIFLFRVPFFSSDEAYFNLRHSKYILENFLPLIYDPQSYGGNIILNTHIFHYFLSIFDLLFTDVIVYKILPALLASSIVIIIYYFIKDITKNDFAALFGALLAAFIPIYIETTLNQISVLSLFIPLLLLGLYFFLEIKEKQKWFLYLSVILILLDPLNLLMIFTLFIFALLMYAESLSLKKEEKESIGLFIVFFLLVNLILYKSLYLKQGLAAIWQNLPLELYGQIFQNFNILETINYIGFIPLILGVIGLIIYKEKNRTITLFRAILIADFTLLLLRLIPFQEGILFMAVILCITAGISMDKFIQYFRLTKLARLEKIVLSSFILLTVVSLVIPSVGVATNLIDTGIQKEEIEAMQWLKFNTPRSSVILGNAYEGNLIINLADRTNVWDTQFFHAENRITDVEIIYTTESLIKAKKAMDKYSVDYIYFSKKTQELYDVKSLAYTSDENCFKEVYKNEFGIIYQVVC